MWANRSICSYSDYNLAYVAEFQYKTGYATIKNGRYAGADAGFQVRGGGGALKKIAPSGGRRENFWGISCEKSRFYTKKSYFFQF